jgi:triacylglycerol lipase
MSHSGSRDRLAWLQRMLVGSVLACSALWWLWCRAHELGPGWWLLGWSVTLLPHAWVLGIEFTLMWLRSTDSKPIGLRRILRAWAAEVVAGVRVFAWSQPFRHRVVQNRLSTSHPGRTGVVLVHGFVCNRGLWNSWMQSLRRDERAYVAVTLEPVFGSIDAYCDAVESAVTDVTRATGRPPWIVAHSMGGLALRAWLRSAKSDQRIAGAMTIGTPHHGTWLAHLGFSRNTRQMRLNSRWLTELARAEPPDRYGKFVCVYSDCDNIVFPVQTAILPGAEPICVCGAGHVDLVFRSETLIELRRRLQISDGA